MAKACRQAVGTIASATNRHQGPRAFAAFGSLICVNRLNLWLVFGCGFAALGNLWIGYELKS